MSDNLKLPAYPQPMVIDSSNNSMATIEYSEKYAGFSKHEKAALIIAGALVSKYNIKEYEDQLTIAQLATELSAAILQKVDNYKL
jgi:hypothetical protein